MSSVDLSSSVLDLERVRDEARDALFDALASRRGRKALVLDPRLGAPLMRITEMSSLRQHGVDRLYYLEGGTLETTCHEVVFLVRPRLELMHKLAEIVKSVLDEVDAATREHERAYSGKPANDPSVLPSQRCPDSPSSSSPRRTLSCEKLLDHLGVLGVLELDAVAMDFIPFERDVISIEHHNAYRDLAVENDNTSLFYVARAIHELQKVTGEAPIVKGKGAAAKEVAEIMSGCDARPCTTRRSRRSRRRILRTRIPMGATRRTRTGTTPSRRGEKSGEVRHRLRRASTGSAETRRARAPPASPHVDMILLLDRAVDPVTLCTQLTYEGLIDEIIGVKNGAVEVPDDEGKTVKARLNSNDALFRELRDLKLRARVRRAAGQVQRDSEGLSEHQGVQGGGAGGFRNRRFRAVRSRITCRARDSTCTPPSPSTFWTARAAPCTSSASSCAIWTSSARASRVTRGTNLRARRDDDLHGRVRRVARLLSRSPPSPTAAFPRNRTTTYGARWCTRTARRCCSCC